MNRLDALLGRFTGKHVLVVGDLMLDEYIWGNVTRISPEAPVMVVDAERESSVPGGAANVAHNVVALGARATMVGVVGDDLPGQRLRETLEETGIGTDGLIVDPLRRTTRKTRVIAHHQQVLRVDRENRTVMAQPVADALCETVRSVIPSCDAVILSDYRKGCLTERVIAQIIECATASRVLITANPKPQSAADYSGADVISLNRVEAETLVGRDLPDPAAVTDACSSLPTRIGVEAILVTLGEQGMVAVSRDGVEHVPVRVVEVYDTAGAGDTVIATLTLGLAAKASLSDAIHVANLAAGCVVRKVGVATTTPGELMALAHNEQPPA